MESQLQKIQRLAEQRAKELDKSNYQKYHGLFDIAIRHLRKQDVMLYGGFAINELMPRKDKIYEKFTLPDIDVFSVRSLKVAQDMVRDFRERGHELSNYTEALHPGTYKVFVEGVQVADITGISKAAFAKLARGAVRGESGLRVVNPQFLRLSLHLLLSQSSTADRWPKVFARLAKFYRHFPPKACSPASAPTAPAPLPEDAVAAMYRHLKEVPCVVFGSREIHEMLGDAAVLTGVPQIQVIVEGDLKEAAQGFSKAAGVHLVASKVHAGDDFIGPHIFLSYKGVRVVAIYTVEECITYNLFKGLKVATIHTMLRMYLSMMMSPYRHFEKMTDHLECMVNALSLLQQDAATRSRKQLLQQLVLDCFGTQRGIYTLKRERLLRLLEK
jgi:hypothetical protein